MRSSWPPRSSTSTGTHHIESTTASSGTLSHQALCPRQQGPAHDIAAFWVPRRTHVCDRILEDEGVLGDVHLASYPLDFIPFEADVLSLELPSAFRVRSCLLCAQLLQARQVTNTA